MGRLQFSQQGGHNYLLRTITGIASWVSSRLFSELSTCDRIIHDACVSRLSDYILLLNVAFICLLIHDNVKNTEYFRDCGEAHLFHIY